MRALLIPKMLEETTMSKTLISMLTLGAFVALAVTPTATAGDDPPLADCERVLFLHWVDYSRHYVCVDQDGDLEDGECLVGYQRDGIKDSTSFCAA